MQGNPLGDTGNHEIEAAIARTALTYDLMPYASNPFPQTHPGRLAAIARMFGLETTPLSTARVLELGCASGGNLIPLASLNPAGRFVGVDLSRTQVAAGRSRIAQAGLTNIEIHCQSLTDLDSTIGSFDYIICHGVFSWVPVVVRHAILRICRERLTPHGVAVVSYNVLPGWRMWQAVRDCLLQHVPFGHDFNARVQEARKLLAFLAEHSFPANTYKAVYKQWNDSFAKLADDYLAHEFLEGTNEPCTVREFVDMAEANGLTFLGDIDLASMILENYPPDAAAGAREMGRGQLVATEQYLDMLSGRTFRQTLLVQGTRLASINRQLAPERVEPLHFLGAGDFLITPAATGGGTLANSTGRSITFSDNDLLALLTRFVARFPASSSLEQLVPKDASADTAEQLRALAKDAFYKMVLVGLVTATTEPVAAACVPGERPAVAAVARLDAARGSTATANLRHERVAFDALGQALLPLLDGSRSADDLATHVLDLVKNGQLSFARDGVQLKDQEDLRSVVNEQVKQQLALFAAAALLIG